MTAVGTFRPNPSVKFSPRTHDAKVQIEASGVAPQVVAKAYRPKLLPALASLLEMMTASKFCRPKGPRPVAADRCGTCLKKNWDCRCSH